MWTIGVTDRPRFPRFPSELEKRGNARLRPHTQGTTASKELAEVKDRTVGPAVAVTPIGADIETGRATP